MLDYQPPLPEDVLVSRSFADEIATEVQLIFRALDRAAEKLMRRGSNFPPSNSAALSREGLDYVSPHGLISMLRNESHYLPFDAQGQQDAQEFLRFLLDKLDDAFHAAAERDRNRDWKRLSCLSKYSSSVACAQPNTTGKVSQSLPSRPESTTSSSTDPLTSESASPSNGSGSNAALYLSGNESLVNVKRPRLHRACKAQVSDHQHWSESGQVTMNSKNDRGCYKACISSPCLTSAGDVAREGISKHAAHESVDARRDDKVSNKAIACRDEVSSEVEKPDCERSPNVSPVTQPPPKKPRLADEKEMTNLDLVMGGLLEAAFRPDIVSEVFRGTAQTVTRCMQCEKSNKRAESYLDVSLPVEFGKSLTWSLTTHGKDEVMDGSNKYSCDFCCTYQEARQHWRISKVPPLFTVHLKLFAFASSRPLGAKVGAAMPCPFNLRLTKWCTDDCEQRNLEYNLTSIIVHEGSSSSSGHYYAYINVPKLGWYHFDDSEVSVADEDEIRRCLFTSLASRTTAYLLFYEQQPAAE